MGSADKFVQKKGDLILPMSHPYFYQYGFKSLKLIYENGQMCVMK